MKSVTPQDLRGLYVPPPDSHKGQNGRLLIIGGSHLFHAASIWSLEVASRIVDLVHYSSVPENNDVVLAVKKQFRDGIVVPREDVMAYIEEDDAILIGPGMTRDEETKDLTDRLLKKYPHKQWVIDAGALQMMDLALMPKNAILTPHQGEFESLLKRAEVARPIFRAVRSLADARAPSADVSKLSELPALRESVSQFAQKYQCVVLLKGKMDIASDGKEVRIIKGGNAGMTKGGTGDVLAGLIAALVCKNAPFLATNAGSYINKTAGDELAKTVGVYFNASDLAHQIPKTMKQLFVR